MVRPLARWRVHPNVVTLISIILTFAAVPLFAWKYWLAGFLCSYGMSVLDSVDGKLARLTFSASRLGDILDHGLDQIHPPLWYFGWAWGLSDGDPTATVWTAAWWMLIFYVIDRLVAAFFNYRNGRSIHGFTSLDVQMRTFISRRNINLPLFTVGLILGVPVPAFLFIVLWQLATLVFHLERLVQFWNGRETVEAAG
jgi:phosphatidylglycerophosphate synthase